MSPSSPSSPAACASLGARARSALLALAVLAVLGGMTALQTATAPPASAHDVLIRTVPAGGASIGQLPGEVQLIFEEPPLKLGTQVIVSGPNGPAQQGKPVIDGSTVRQQLAPGAPAGKYTVDYRVTSDDGHVVSGSFSFTAQKGAAGADAKPSGATATPLAPGASTSASAPAGRSAASPQPSSSAPAAASNDSGKGMSWPVPPSILAWGIVLIVLILAGISYLVKRLKGHGGDDDLHG
ncbi:MAG TPA: copper resistance CopC family protein [Segeticoccus sp.]|uniref:copper resistance CopC family protein n=1 Tax=Segeticoccus sp. TaxID=2706531 RepID=UPI002D7E411C|nr:copper resistance CopC family protein [Segeticoccus sp.]HET8599275.1 copper resistance CopC family protein [Segeticoccus sp.]